MVVVVVRVVVEMVVEMDVAVDMVLAEVHDAMLTQPDAPDGADAAGAAGDVADYSDAAAAADAADFQTVPTGCLSGEVCYTPQGTFYALSIGQSSSFTGLNLTHTYNNRLQPNEFKASSTGGNAIDITYGFVDPVTSHNAGHLYALTNNLDTTRSHLHI